MIEIKIVKTASENVTDSLYQYDLGQKLKITGANLTETPKIHFANASSKYALIVSPTMSDGVITVDIPNSLLAEHLPIFAYIYTVGDKVGQTIHVIKIPVNKRAKPADYEALADENLISYTQLDTRVNELVKEWSGAFDDTQEALRQLTLKVGSVVSAPVALSMGMYNAVTTFGDDGSITETGDGWSRVTTFEADGRFNLF